MYTFCPFLTPDIEELQTRQILSFPLSEHVFLYFIHEYFLPVQSSGLTVSSALKKCASSVMSCVLMKNMLFKSLFFCRYRSFLTLLSILFCFQFCEVGLSCVYIDFFGFILVGILLSFLNMERLTFIAKFEEFSAIISLYSSSDSHSLFLLGLGIFLLSFAHIGYFSCSIFKFPDGFLSVLSTVFLSISTKSLFLLLYFSVKIFHFVLQTLPFFAKISYFFFFIFF